MWICLECGYIFSQPVEYQERHGLDTPPYERMEGCPNIGGKGGRPLGVCSGRTCNGSFEPAGQCVECGKISALRTLREGLCIDCQKRVLRIFERQMERFTVQERKFLNEIFDGRWF